MVAGLEEPTPGTHPARRRRHHRPQALQAAGQHGLPELRALPAPDDLRERRLRAAPHEGARTSTARSREMLELVQLEQYAERDGRPSSPAASSSGSRWPARSSTGRRCCCSTSRSAPSTSSCAGRCRSSSSGSRPRSGITFVHVTHDQEEAMTMADTIAVMNDGAHRADGVARRALRAPADDVRGQLPRPVQPGQGHGRRRRTATSSRSTSRAPRCAARRDARPRCTTATVWVGVRPEKIYLAPADDEDAGGGNTPAGGRGHRRQLRRRQHAVPRPDAVGPGAHGLRAEHRRPTSGFRAATRSTCTGRPEHTFLLDASQDAHAGVEPEDDA